MPHNNKFSCLNIGLSIGKKVLRKRMANIFHDSGWHLSHICGAIIVVEGVGFAPFPSPQNIN
tara:strand:- start:527 stop:712 length:186 start_codon:yes stop_codon:yes gene_type:complete